MLDLTLLEINRNVNDRTDEGAQNDGKNGQMDEQRKNEATYPSHTVELHGSNTDGSFTTAASNSFLSR